MLTSSLLRFGGAQLWPSNVEVSMGVAIKMDDLGVPLSRKPPCQVLQQGLNSSIHDLDASAENFVRSSAAKAAPAPNRWVNQETLCSGVLKKSRLKLHLSGCWYFVSGFFWLWGRDVLDLFAMMFSQIPPISHQSGGILDVLKQLQLEDEALLVAAAVARASANFHLSPGAVAASAVAVGRDTRCAVDAICSSAALELPVPHVAYLAARTAASAVQRPLGAVWDGAGECGTHGLAGGARRGLSGGVDLGMLVGSGIFKTHFRSRRWDDLG